MVGKILKNLRESKNMKQDELGKLLNLSPSSIGMYERNQRDPDTDTLQKIAEIFSVSTDYLLGKSFADDIQSLTEQLDKLVSFADDTTLLTEEQRKKALALAMKLLKRIE